MKGDPTVPCKDCKERYLACHDHCDKYKTFRKNLIDKKKMIKDSKLKDKLCTSYVIDTMEKLRKGSNRRHG